MKVLLVQMSFLGDMVLSTPLIAALKKSHPEAEIWIMCTPASAGLVKADPLVKGVISYDKKKGLKAFKSTLSEIRNNNFAIVYSLHRSFRTSLLLFLSGIKQRVGFQQASASFLYNVRRNRQNLEHDVLRNLSLVYADVQAPDVPDELRLYPPEASLYSQFLEGLNADKFVVLVPGSVWATKRWSWQGYREVAAHFIDQGYSVILLGAPNEVEIASKVGQGLNVHNFVGKTSIKQLVGIISVAKLVVCNDSMALHVSSALKIPTVVIFCATSPSFGFGPWKNKSIIVENEELECKPCRRHGSNVCPTGTELCMTGVSSGRVIKAAQELLGDR